MLHSAALPKPRWEAGLWEQEMSPGPMVSGTFSPAPLLVSQNWVTALLFLALLYQVLWFTLLFSELQGKKIICIN